MPMAFVIKYCYVITAFRTLPFLTKASTGGSLSEVTKVSI